MSVCLCAHQSVNPSVCVCVRVHEKERREEESKAWWKKGRKHAFWFILQMVLRKQPFFIPHARNLLRSIPLLSLRSMFLNKSHHEPREWWEVRKEAMKQDVKKGSRQGRKQGGKWVSEETFQMKQEKRKAKAEARKAWTSKWQKTNLVRRLSACLDAASCKRSPPRTRESLPAPPSLYPYRRCRGGRPPFSLPLHEIVVRFEFSSCFWT